MKTNYQKVTIFNRVMGLAEPDGEVGKSSEAQRKLRHDLIIEEGITERLQARESEDLADIMDAHGDSLVVLYGEANDYKFDSDVIFAIVNYANMTKVCKTPDEAHESVVAYGRGTHPDKMGAVIEAHWDIVQVYEEDHYVVYNSATGKGLKSVNFKDPKPTLQAYANLLLNVPDVNDELRRIMNTYSDEELIASIHRMDDELTNK